MFFHKGEKECQLLFAKHWKFLTADVMQYNLLRRTWNVWHGDISNTPTE
jgi:hypothetical protein